MQPDGINFGTGIYWSAVSKSECERFARDPGLGDLSLRLYFAAIWRMNAIGHAEFFTGELAEVLADKSNRPLSGSGLPNAIKRAKTKGLVGADSNSRCLTLPHHHVQTAKGGRSCRTHGVRSAWQYKASTSRAA
ncbi:hypothetical protein ADK52_15000 [Streptomyces sp. WM6372]|uniref:hypothetical protein n=1 Tax=Streptomyces sp. WM6372 TaxID=1415555 RepID=UPI0006B00F4F|nr:hypothetical protein [Streptomyces sp. WM6372]KOU24075.1 hypothetical protein ADK52_15000 [Streptomyces sp. WM6372]